MIRTLRDVGPKFADLPRGMYDILVASSNYDREFWDCEIFYADGSRSGSILKAAMRVTAVNVRPTETDFEIQISITEDVYDMLPGLPNNGCFNFTLPRNRDFLEKEANLVKLDARYTMDIRYFVGLLFMAVKTGLSEPMTVISTSFEWDL